MYTMGIDVGSASSKAVILRDGREVVAALAAEGESRIAGCGYIDRGYPALEQMLARLGARICREMPPEAPD